MPQQPPIPVQYSNVQYSNVQYSNVQHSNVQYSNVQPSYPCAVFKWDRIGIKLQDSPQHVRYSVCLKVQPYI